MAVVPAGMATAAGADDAGAVAVVGAVVVEVAGAGAVAAGDVAALGAVGVAVCAAVVSDEDLLPSPERRSLRRSVRVSCSAISVTAASNC